ncbi:hypothetical protein HYS82_01145 [Candidatus Amesbacteria bacterium]|nr:hypothetical protein [Candidatus Amesbacteria bacterium]MBI2587332.1 hypothetical protein [Candidatus Amesbacteria bacterium]
MDKTDQINLLREELQEFKNDWWNKRMNSYHEFNDYLKVIKTDIRDINSKLGQLLHHKNSDIIKP